MVCGRMLRLLMYNKASKKKMLKASSLAVEKKYFFQSCKLATYLTFSVEWVSTLDIFLSIFAMNSTVGTKMWRVYQMPPS